MIQPQLWHYIRDMYSTSKRQVQYGQRCSKSFVVDLGVAQGDTLSCIIFNLFIDDLVPKCIRPALV
jgi:hypothetical protein